jgi:alpha-galactosidase
VPARRGARAADPAGQLVLDLSRPEVVDHLFGAIDLLLSTDPIAALKWDHNRDLFPAASRGHPSAHAQTIGFTHCSPRPQGASAGRDRRLRQRRRADRLRHRRAGRPCLGERQYRRGGAAPHPPRHEPVLPAGADRRAFRSIAEPHDVAAPGVEFRARVAMFAHFGIEADPARLTPEERERLARQVADYKSWRGLIHSGDQLYADCDDPA